MTVENRFLMLPTSSWLIAPALALAGWAAAAIRRRRRLQLPPPATTTYRLGYPDVGETVGRFDLVERLGNGEYTAIYRGRASTAPREAVVEVVWPGDLEVPSFRTEFFGEIERQAALDHPNLVRIYEWSAGPAGYHAREWVDGETFAATEALPILRALSDALQVLDALMHLHNHGIVCKRLDPDCIFRTSGGRIKVWTLNEPAREHYSCAAVVPPFFFMSPEQILGNPSDRSDQYLVGSFAWYLLVGHGPFKVSDPMELIVKVINEEPPPLSGVPAELEEVLRKMVAKDPKDRYPDLAAAREALQRFA